MKIYVMVDGSNRVIGWSSLPTPNEEIEVELQENDSFFTDIPFDYQYENGSLVKDNAFALSKVKEKKIAELEAQCSAVIMGGFTSSALGVQHTYPSDAEAMTYYIATMLRFANDPTFTVVNQKTLDAGYLPHTKEQFIQVFNDGHQNGIEQDTHLAQLKADISAAQTNEDLDKISW